MMRVPTVVPSVILKFSNEETGYVIILGQPCNQLSLGGVFR